MCSTSNSFTLIQLFEILIVVAEYLGFQLANFTIAFEIFLLNMCQALVDRVSKLIFQTQLNNITEVKVSADVAILLRLSMI